MKRRLNGWKIARIRGVDVKLHVSLLFILAYVWLIGSLQFPLVAEQAGWNASQLHGPPALWGAVFAIALFASVLVHEFGHVIMAQSLGGTVDGITLMMLGGVSEIRKMPQGRLQEFKVAIVGPLVSLALAAILLVSRLAFLQPEWSLFAYWLGTVNIVLAVFNLIPAFPLDGGRALRSLLSLRQSQVKATRTAVKVGNIFAAVFALVGLLQFNILLVLIALFLYSVGHGELAVLETQTALEGLLAGAVGKRIPAVDERDSLEQAVALMKAHGILVLPVETISLDAATISLKQASKVPRERWSATTVREVMETDDRTLDMADPVSPALTELLSSDNQALPLKERGHLVGVITADDLNHELQLRMLNEPEKKAG